MCYDVLKFLLNWLLFDCTMFVWLLLLLFEVRIDRFSGCDVLVLSWFSLTETRYTRPGWSPQIVWLEDVISSLTHQPGCMAKPRISSPLLKYWLLIHELERVQGVMRKWEILISRWHVLVLDFRPKSLPLPRSGSGFLLQVARSHVSAVGSRRKSPTPINILDLIEGWLKQQQ